MKRKKKQTPRSRPIALILLGIVLLIVSGIVLIFDPFKGNAPAGTPTAAQANIPFPEVERIDPVTAREALDTGGAIFVDTRSPEEYTQATILGAYNFPVDEVASRLDELDKDAWIITFCT